MLLGLGAARARLLHTRLTLRCDGAQLRYKVLVLCEQRRLVLLLHRVQFVLERSGRRLARGARAQIGRLERQTLLLLLGAHASDFVFERVALGAPPRDQRFELGGALSGMHVRVVQSLVLGGGEARARRQHHRGGVV